MIPPDWTRKRIASRDGWRWYWQFIGPKHTGLWWLPMWAQRIVVRRGNWLACKVIGHHRFIPGICTTCNTVYDQAKYDEWTADYGRW